MAERLKERLLANTSSSVDCTSDGQSSSMAGADFVCGPDAYRDLPRLIEDAQAGIQGANVALSLEETYADVTPVRKCIHVSSDQDCATDRVSPCALVSVMRGCNNMCAFCVVPFVRGRERSRPLASIMDEARSLFDEGVREITLLGQNVNSYCDRSTAGAAEDPRNAVTEQLLTPGFRTVYRMHPAGGLRFIDLLDQISRISPELRIRFTSPHPKDFPQEVLQLIAERANLCSALHMPAQSGSHDVLERMGRGYSPEAYIQLIETAQHLIPNVAITSDFIAGFCGETEADHRQSVELINRVGYAFTFCYPYSMREKTRAYHRLIDDVPVEAKQRRHLELKAAGREASLRFNRAQIGCVQLILVEGVSRRSADYMYGRNDANVKVICPKLSVGLTSAAPIILEPGDYVAVRITQANAQTLHGQVLWKSTAQEFHHRVSPSGELNDHPSYPVGVCD